jgi:hypothetical protein
MYIIFAYGIRFIYILFNLQKGTLIYVGVNAGDSLTRIFYKFKELNSKVNQLEAKK